MLIRLLIGVLCLVGSVAPLASAASPDRPVESRIDSVTVYPSSARVTRIATVDLAAGNTSVSFNGLPNRLLDDSLRVAGVGPAGVSIFGATVVQVPHVETTAEDVRKAEEALTELTDRDRAFEDELRRSNGLLSLLDSLRSTFVRERMENLAVRAMDPKEWSGFIEFVAGQYDRVLQQLRDTEAARRELAKQIQAAQRALDQIRGRGSQITKNVSIDLRASQPGPVELSVSYVVPSASWSPTWDARLDPDAGTIALSLHGSVRQHSGEDWENVILTLSTARPALGVAVPDLPPQYLDPIRPLRSVAPMAMTPSAREEGIASDARLDKVEAGRLVAAEAITQAEADISQGLLAATFSAPRRESIESTGTPRRAFLVAVPLAAELARITAPKANEQVVLTAKAVNDSGVVLLAGPVNIFLGDELTGKTTLDLTAPGDEIRLAFGPDDRVKVKRTIVERKHETTGLFAKEELIRYRVRSTVKNLYATPTIITFIDQVPVSRDERIKVTILDGSTKPTDSDDPTKPGVRRYTYTLGPNEEQIIELGYEVRYPKGQMIGGLD